MKKFCLFCVAVLVAACAMAGTNVFATQNFLQKDDVVAIADGDDVDLYLDCFENAVKAKDMDLAAKIAKIHLFGRKNTWRLFQIGKNAIFWKKLG